METSTVQAAIGDRVSFRIPERGGFSYGFGDVQKVNRKTYRVVDRKFPGETIYLVSKELVWAVYPPSELVDLVLTLQ